MGYVITAIISIIFGVLISWKTTQLYDRKLRKDMTREFEAVASYTRALTGMATPEELLVNAGVDPKQAKVLGKNKYTPETLADADSADIADLLEITPRQAKVLILSVQNADSQG